MVKSVRILERLRTAIHGSDLVFSRRGVPHLLVDYGGLNISVCYFMRSKSFKVWTGCGTLMNLLVAEVKTENEVIQQVESLLCPAHGFDKQSFRKRKVVL